MTANQAHHPGHSALVLVMGLVTALAVAACDEPPPSPMALMQAAARADGDAEHARAAIGGPSLRAQLEIYYGERFAEEPGAAPQRPQASAAHPD